MEDEEEYDDEDYETWVPNRRFRKVDVVVLGVNFAYRLVGAVHSTLEDVVQLVAGHANFEVERDTFREEAMLEIETITGEQDG
jgi:hypothetical protein